MAIVERHLPKYTAIKGPDLDKPWRESFPDFPQDEMDPFEKQRIFAGDIIRIKSLFSVYPQTAGIVPPDLLDRLLILNDKEYKSIWKEFYGEAELPSGFNLSEARIGIISKSKMRKKAAESKMSREDTLRLFGVHELLHVLEPQELWKPKDGSEQNMLKRSGVAMLCPWAFPPPGMVTTGSCAGRCAREWTSRPDSANLSKSLKAFTIRFGKR